jgi:hypothetical protein
MPEMIKKEDIIIDGKMNYLNFQIEFNEDGSPIDCHKVQC